MPWKRQIVSSCVLSLWWVPKPWVNPYSFAAHFATIVLWTQSSVWLAIASQLIGIVLQHRAAWRRLGSERVMNMRSLSTLTAGSHIRDDKQEDNHPHSYEHAPYKHSGFSLSLFPCYFTLEGLYLSSHSSHKAHYLDLSIHF